MGEYNLNRLQRLLMFKIFLIAFFVLASSASWNSVLAAGLNEDFNSELLDASRSGDVKAIWGLLKKGADVNTKNDFGETPLIRASQQNHVQAVDILLEKGADINAMDNYGQSALIWASRHHNADVVEALVEKGADIDIHDSAGQTALMWATKYRYDDIVEALKVGTAHHLK